MLCFLCGKEIGWLRTMVDRQYCSAGNRKDARLASANALREEEDEQEIWSVAKTRQRIGRSSPSNQTASIFAFLTFYAWRGRYTPDYYTPIEMGGLYWHFVDIVWIYLFPLLYLIDRKPLH